ncbi:MAG TPA: TonB-dependent receptor [Bryobacteraceae bacterium]|nr:TonB-dependent receptor [Bryobacteraceae bacterium]
MTLLCAFAPLFAADIGLSGRVVDEDDAPVRGAVVILRPAPGSNISAPAEGWRAETGPSGAFSLTVPSGSDFLVSVRRQGYYALADQATHVEPGQELTLSISSVREVFQSADVNATTSPLEAGQAQNQEELTGTEINDIFYANSHSLRNSVNLMPGVIQDAAGSLHANGSSENQLQYLLDGFDIANPISGNFQTVLAVEGIRSMDLTSGRSSPDLGKGSAGALAINAENGTDAFRFTTTDFLPGLSVQNGLHLGNWYPRAGVSGPIVRGRAWFSDTFNSEYNQAIVPGLARGQNTRSGWAGANLVHAQWNLTPSQILFADFLFNADNEGRVGLGPLSPVSTTTSVDTREYFASLKDQIYLGHGTLVEFGFAHNYYSSAQSPQGQDLYVISPEGASGNYFVNALQTGSRDEGLLHAYLPRFEFLGSHQFEAGGDADWLSYSGDFRRTGYDLLGLSGELISQTLFSSPAMFHVGDAEAASYLLDTWRISKRLQFNLGFRQDWDRRVHSAAVAPRFSFSWSPWASIRTRISGGYSVTRGAVTLDMFGRPFDQTAFTTSYLANGAPAGPPAATTFTSPSSGLKLPRAANWNLNLDRQLSARLYLAAKYLRRRSTDEFAFLNTLAPDAPPSLLPLPNGASPGLYRLTNLRRDDYDSLQLSLRQTLSGQFEWMVSFTRSRAVSNGVLDPSLPQPLQILPSLVPMPWDAPNRFLAWGYLPLPWKKWAVSALADVRSGFPFSIRDQDGAVIGSIDSYRYPLKFDLNIALERTVVFHGYRFAVRGGMNNIAGRLNPTAVNNVAGAPGFRQFYGAEGRHFVFRIRFFGRAGSHT